VYVAKNGDDGATGTEKSPFATIERARDGRARAIPEPSTSAKACTRRPGRSR
jgi:hypothetical protein